MSPAETPSSAFFLDLNIIRSRIPIRFGDLVRCKDAIQDILQPQIYRRSKKHLHEATIEKIN